MSPKREHYLSSEENKEVVEGLYAVDDMGWNLLIGRLLLDCHLTCNKYCKQMGEEA